MSVRRLRVGIVDLIARGPTRSPYARLMNPNFATIMPQVVGVWAEELGHDVHYLTYTGTEDLERELSHPLDVLFVCAFTPAAYLAYGLSSWLRSRGVVTVLGGPHARAYPEDALHHFDYVTGFTDKALIRDLLADAARQGGRGVHLGARSQPSELPGLRERWRFVRHNIAKSRMVTSVPMLASVGCPYRCSFCVDARVDYAPFARDQIRDDLRFLRQQIPSPTVGWHDPNFGVRFDEHLGAIADAAPPGSIRFVFECSLSLLRESRLRELQRQGFEALTLGIESWFDFNDKARQRRQRGVDKVDAVAAHVDLVTRFIPYVQTNFVWGLDHDEGAEPFALTKRFLELAPAAFPAYNLFTAFGGSSPLAVELARAGRVLDVPFHFQDTSSMHNVRLRHYGVAELYGLLADLVRASYSPRATARRVRRNRHPLTSGVRWMNGIRSLSSHWRVHHYDRMARLGGSDPALAALLAGESDRPSPRLASQVVSDLGRFAAHLPASIGDDLAGRPSSPPRLAA